MAKIITKTEKDRLLREREQTLQALKEARVRLAEAKAKGDLSENAEYDTAVNEIEQYSNIINAIDTKISSADVISSKVFIVIINSFHDNRDIAFKVELGTVDTLSFDLDAIEGQDIEKIKQLDPLAVSALPEGIVTVHSKLGGCLDRLNFDTNKGWQTFSYIDNKQTKRTFMASLVSSV